MNWTHTKNDSYEKWDSDCDDYQILHKPGGKYRLISFIHDPTPEFPEAEFWMREYPTLEAAQRQAEMM